MQRLALNPGSGSRVSWIVSSALAQMRIVFFHDCFAGIMMFMNQEYFQRLLNARPFEPFAVQLSSGVTHPVRYPGCAILTRTRLVIVDPDADHIDVCALLHIVKVEILSGS
jgi:hypothetical protein